MGDDALTIPGRVYPAGSSRLIPARLVVGTGRAALFDEAGSLIADLDSAELRFEAPVGQAARRATLPDGTLFETDDIAAADRLAADSLGHRLHRAERFSPQLLLVLGAAVLGVLAIWRFALPAIVWVAVALTPEPLRDAIDAGTLKSFDLVYAKPTRLSQDYRSRAQAVLDELVKAMPDADRKDYQLHFRYAPILGPNAVALPGGTVVMTDALLEEFNDPDIIAGVLGHELVHVVESHGLTQLYRSLGVYVLVALIAGDTGPILEDILLEGGVLVSLSYSRAHERAADDFGIRLAKAAGYDPAGLIRFFAALPDAAQTESGWDASHPATGERIQAIEDYLATQ